MFPSRLLPTVSVLTNLVNYLISFPLILMFLWISNVDIDVYSAVGVIPLIIVIQLLITEGLVLITSSLNVFYRDIQHLLANFITLWFFITPILYPVSMVPPQYSWITRYNPMAPIMQAYQSVLYYGRSPDWMSLAWVGVFSVVIFIVGMLVFDRKKHRFAEIL
jgi:ABC-type polysaccharide/polyol phosphate export permease